MSVYWVEKDELFPVALKVLERPRIILDIGCGIYPQKFIRPLVHICCEPFDQYVEYLQKATKNEYNRNYIIIKATWAEAVKFFPPQSVDSVFLLDVIEHLKKDEALELLLETERIVRKQIIVFTPLGFHAQKHQDGKDAWGFDGGSWQEHRSGWYPEDFDDTWDVYATKEFRITDNLGMRLEKPGGAFWAFKSFAEGESHDKEIDLKKEEIHALVDMAIDISPNILFNLFARLMRLSKKIITSEEGKRIISSLHKLKYKISK